MRHAERIRLIKRLQREHLPLAEIRSRMTDVQRERWEDMTNVLYRSAALWYGERRYGRVPESA